MAAVSGLLAVEVSEGQQRAQTYRMLVFRTNDSFRNSCIHLLKTTRYTRPARRGLHLPQGQPRSHHCISPCQLARRAPPLDLPTVKLILREAGVTITEL